MTNQETIANLNMIRIAFVEPVTKEQRKLIDDTFDNAIKALEQESGKWIDKEISNPDYPLQDRKIIECNKCHYGIVQARLGYTNYCPNCGAKMERGEE